MAINLGKLTEQQTFDLVVEAVQNLNIERVVEALKAALSDDDKAEVVAQLEV